MAILPPFDELRIEVVDTPGEEAGLAAFLATREKTLEKEQLELDLLRAGVVLPTPEEPAPDLSDPNVRPARRIESSFQLGARPALL
jgi:hypothetical protein